MRDDVRRAFENLTEAPHPSLRAAIRARLAAGPPRASSPYLRLAAVAAAVLVLVAAGAGGWSLLSHRGAPGGLATSRPPTPTPAPASPAPSPSASATPPLLTGFACTATSGGSGSNLATVTAVRTGTQAGYDRLVFQFDGPVPPYTITPQGTPDFTGGASGQGYHLQGTRGIKVTIQSSAVTPAGRQSYGGPDDIVTGYPALREARNIGDFERVYGWGLGTAGSGCFRVLTLTGPDRLVIDVQQG